MKVLMIGDIYSTVGREMVKKYIPKIKEKEGIDLVIANGENVSHGKGINKNHYIFLKENEVDIITSGNHIFKHRDALEYIEDVTDLLKPVNLNEYTPGKGTVVLNVRGKKVRVTNIMGRSFMEPCDNPFSAMDNILREDDSDIHIVDFHGEASAEKLAFAYNYDGYISLLAGTHTHVQTADERILPKGTGFITDLGFTGCYESVIGADIDLVIKKERTGLPVRFEPAEGKGQLCGLIATIDEKTGKTVQMKRLFIKE